MPSSTGTSQERHGPQATGHRKNEPEQMMIDETPNGGPLN
jgi:hypothetical protein